MKIFNFKNGESFSNKINQIIRNSQSGLIYDYQFEHILIESEKFAIDFAKWMDELRRYDNEKYVSYTYEYLLEQYKKSKSL